MSINGLLRLAVVAVVVLMFVSGCSSCGSSTGGNGGGGGSGDCVINETVAPPAKGESVQDSDYDASIMRLTDKAVDNYSGPGMQNEYARTDPENSDATYLILRSNDGQWYLYNATNYQLIKHLPDIATGGEEPEPRWDASNPKTFYYLSGMKLLSYNVDTDESNVVHDFSPTFANGAYITTKTEGDASLDRRYWCFMVEDESYNLLSVVIYDRTTDTLLGQKSSGFPDAINWVSMDMSGSNCVIGYEDSDNDSDDQTPPVDVFSHTFTHVATLPNGSNGHMDLALTSDGKDVMVYQNTATDWIAMADLSTGTETNLVEIPFGTNPDIGIHISGNCAETPGWALVSTYGSFNPPPDSSHSWMDNLLFMVELKANPTIKNIAHTHAFTSLNYDGEKNYFAEAFATVNTRGNTVYWGANWNNCSAEYSDEYKTSVP